MKKKKSKLISIAAIGKNRAIGKNNKLLWHIPDDLKRFKELTLGYPIIMGRKTYESLPENFRPLPGRENIIVTRNKDYNAPGAKITNSLEEAIEYGQSLEKEKIFIGGGQQIYKQAMPFVNELYLTIINEEKDGDAFFPEYPDFKEILYKKEKEYKGIRYSWINLKK
ncbi:MAG: dihydrofolate reductase [Candidatus Paceibacterota bacterium]